jgi:cytosine/adenosine deaminase-related metal-dependent hydrolase
MILYDLNIPGYPGLYHLHCNRRIIQTISPDRKLLDQLTGEERYECAGARLLPGLINSHDHLDFNLFPQLGTAIYSNYSEWGPDIQMVHADTIRAVQKVPLPLRVSWGLYKNLLNGFTTVVNHGNKLVIEGDLVNVFQDCYSLHSLAFEKNWKWKLNNPFKWGKPIVIHAGEGTDVMALDEIKKLKAANFFKKKIVVVHGVAMQPEDATSFAGLVWCPASNFFLLNQTAPVRQLAGRTRIVFGTDSTLTASWNSWQHFRQALGTGMVRENELLPMLGKTPASLWNLPSGEIKEGAAADLLLLPSAGTIFSNNPTDIAAVIKGGEFRLADTRIFRKERLPSSFQSSSSPVIIEGVEKLVWGNVEGLMKQVKGYYPRFKGLMV